MGATLAGAEDGAAARRWPTLRTELGVALASNGRGGGRGWGWAQRWAGLGALMAGAGTGLAVRRECIYVAVGRRRREGERKKNCNMTCGFHILQQIIGDLLEYLL